MGGPKFKEVGGGPAVGLAEDFIRLLRGSLSGNFGGQPTAGQRFDQADPLASTGGIARILQNILGEGAGTLGGSLSEMIRRESERNVGDLRARFGAGGGTSLGTPAAFAESLFRAETAPRTALGVGQLQLSALLPLLQLVGGLSERGIAPRQTVAQPSAFSSFLGTIAPLAATIAGGPIPGAVAGAFSNPLTRGLPGVAELPDLLNIPLPSFSFN